jgi:hypothetical protein
MRSFFSILFLVISGLFLVCITSPIFYPTNNSYNTNQSLPVIFVVSIFWIITLSMGIFLQLPSTRTKSCGLSLIISSIISVLSSLSLLAMAYDKNMEKMFSATLEGKNAIEFFQSLKYTISIPLALAVLIAGTIIYKSAPGRRTDQTQ